RCTVLYSVRRCGFAGSISSPTVFSSLRPPPPTSTLFPYTTLFRSCGERLVALFLPLADLGLDRGLVDALDLVVHVHVDVECLAERSEQMVLVQLRVALDRLVLDSGRDLAQLGERLALQRRKSVGQVFSGVIVPDNTVEASAAASAATCWRLLCVFPR